VLGGVAVRDGAIYRVNDEDFFDIGKLSVKSLNQSVALAINDDAHGYRPEWLGHVWTAFGARGIVALAFWFGALFSEQIRATQKSFPFLEIVGEAGSGKSTLIEFLWKLFGRADYEGFDPSKASLAARARNFAQVAGLPVVLLGLAADYPTPLALDESVASDADLRRWMERGWCGVFVVKPTLLAEPAAVFGELARAKARVVFSSAMETAIGAKAALRWAFAWEGDNGAGEPYALGFGVYPLFRDAVFNGPRAQPFLRWEDVQEINEEVLWNALA